MSSLANRISEEVMSDNSGNYAQCKSCVYRDKDNYQRYYCSKYPKDSGGKPDEFLLNKGKCTLRNPEGGALVDAAESLE